MKTVFTLVYLTYRPGGIDLLAYSLQNQMKDERLWKLVVIDDYKERVERGIAQRYIQERGIPLSYYGPAKRKNRKGPSNLANVMNTGALLADSKYIVFVHDLCFFPPKTVERWCGLTLRYKHRCIIQGVGKMHQAIRPDESDDISLWKNVNFEEGISKIQKNARTWRPTTAEVFYTIFPMEFLDEINGFDERADGNAEWVVFSFFKQAQLNNWNLLTSDLLLAHFIDHNEWDKKDHSSNWNTYEQRYVKNIPDWKMRSPNFYDFEETRLKLASGELSFQSLL